VDSKETTELDSVLCLVNTALLSQNGRHSGKEGINPVKKTGGLTAKAKKGILNLLDQRSGENDGPLLEELCDFTILMALDKVLGQEDMDELCALVQKYSRGQKKGTTVEKKLKRALHSVLLG